MQLGDFLFSRDRWARGYAGLVSVAWRQVVVEVVMACYKILALEIYRVIGVLETKILVDFL